MNFVNIEQFKKAQYENHPFPHVVIDNFFNNDKIDKVLQHINLLSNDTETDTLIDKRSPYEYNKIAWDKNYGEYLKNVFIELNSPEFIQQLEQLTDIKGLIANDITLRGAGIHRIKKDGYLQLHTDFNSYHNNNGDKLDRRINLLIYMNPEWKEEYNGSLSLFNKNTNLCEKKIMPLLNRCVIFNTSKNSVHGHPEPLNVPDNIYRQSIAVYYYTKNTNGNVDFEGDEPHNTIWYSHYNTK